MKTSAATPLSPGRTTVAPRTKQARSVITNGRQLLPELDHRGAWARRFRDLIALHIADLGGADGCSQSELALVRHAAQLRLQLELQEQLWAERFDGVAPVKRLQDYIRTVGTLRRILKTLGLARRTKDVTPDLQTYMRAKYDEADDAAAVE